jgi:L-fucose mutarotase
LIIADTNFPSDSVARQTALGRLLRIDASAAEVAKAVLSLYPLDTFVDDSAARMEIVGKPDEIPAVQKEVQKEVDKAEGKSWPMIAVERYAFYERAKQAYCVIQTGERRFYGCFAFRKGVVPPDAE